MLDMPNYGVAYQQLETVSSAVTSKKIAVIGLGTFLTAKVPICISSGAVAMRVWGVLSAR